MKKTMRRLMAFALAAVMMLAMSATAFAASVTVSGPDIANHKFVAYQIFAGTQEKADGPLCDITWGTNIDADAFLEDLQTAFPTAFGDTCWVTAEGASERHADAVKVSEALGKITSYTEDARKIARIAYANKMGTGTEVGSQTTDLALGYYIIVDETTESETDNLKNAALLQVTSNGRIEITQKVDKPTVEKKVGENLDKDDYGIGDKVPFTITSSVPDSTEYTKYTFEFVDTMSDGLTYLPETLTIKIGGILVEGTIDTETKDSEYITSSDEVNADGTTTLTINMTIKDEMGAHFNKDKNSEAANAIVIEYKATLNNNAEIESKETNEVFLKYSNNPNNDTTTDTPKDVVEVYTYELDVEKYALKEDGISLDITKPLSGAEFILFKTETVDDVQVVKYATHEVETAVSTGKITGWTTDKNLAGVWVSGTDGELGIEGLDNGDYELEEIKAPLGYNKLDETIKVTIESTKTINHIKLEKVGNAKGATLPETGGIGTTILYMVGILAMAAAVFYFVMNSKKKEQ